MKVFTNAYWGIVNDFSFRDLIVENDDDEISGLMLAFRDMLFKQGEFVEQCIRDYYVYETYRMFGTSIMLSWSNMKKLRDYTIWRCRDKSIL